MLIAVYDDNEDIQNPDYVEGVLPDDYNRDDEDFIEDGDSTMTETVARVNKAFPGDCTSAFTNCSIRLLTLLFVYY